MPKYREPVILFLALGDMTRMAVIRELCRGPRSVSELARPFEMALPSFMQHLSVLEDAKWIKTEKQGRVRTCTLNPDALALAGGWLDEQRSLWERRLDQLDDYLLKIKKTEKKEKKNAKD